MKKDKKTPIYFRMIIDDKTGTFLDKFEHLSQVRQFWAILQRVDKRNMMWYSHEQEYLELCRMIKTSSGGSLSIVTARKNLTHFINVGLMLKISRGVYKVNPEYIAFGKDE